MAASVIRSLSAFGLARPVQACFMAVEEEEFEEECEEEFREDVEDCIDEESQVKDPRVTDLYLSNTEMTDRLLRFAELISSDVRRYFGRRQDSDAYDVYAKKPCPDIPTRQHQCSGVVRASCDGPEKLGPLAELFHQTDTKKTATPMIQRQLPSSFWTEPGPDSLDLGDHMPSCYTDAMLGSTESLTISSSSTPDFGDLLAHWASDREPSEFTCDYHLP